MGEDCPNSSCSSDVVLLGFFFWGGDAKPVTLTLNLKLYISRNSEQRQEVHQIWLPTVIAYDDSWNYTSFRWRVTDV